MYFVSTREEDNYCLVYDVYDKLLSFPMMNNIKKKAD